MLTIDLFTEISCPWCLIGMHRLDKVLTERFPALDVEIRHHPILLLKDVSAEGLYIPDLLRSRYGVTNMKAAFARPEQEARDSGLTLDLSLQLRTYSTLAAHALIMAASERGTQHRLAMAITRAYFLEATDIGNAQQLADLAVSYGFERDEALGIALDPSRHPAVERAAAEAGAQGIRSVPHFVFGGRLMLNGGRSEDEIAEAIASAATIA